MRQELCIITMVATIPRVITPIPCSIRRVLTHKAPARLRFLCCPCTTFLRLLLPQRCQLYLGRSTHCSDRCATNLRAPRHISPDRSNDSLHLTSGLNQSGAEVDAQLIDQVKT